MRVRGLVRAGLRRFFVLDGEQAGTFAYYKEEGDAGSPELAAGCIDMCEVTKVTKNAEDDCRIEVAVGEKRTYCFRCDDTKQRETWHTFLGACPPRLASPPRARVSHRGHLGSNLRPCSGRAVHLRRTKSTPSVALPRACACAPPQSVRSRSTPEGRRRAMAVSGGESAANKEGGWGTCL